MTAAFNFAKFSSRQNECPIYKYEITTEDPTVLHTGFKNPENVINHYSGDN